MQEFDTLASIIHRNYGVEKKDLKSSSRLSNLVELRAICAYILKTETKLTTTIIGNQFGQKNHTNIIYYCKRHHNLHGKSESYTDKYNAIQKEYRERQENLRNPEWCQATLKSLLEKKEDTDNEIMEISGRLKQKPNSHRIKIQDRKNMNVGHVLGELDELSNLISLFNTKFNRNYSVASMYISKKDGLQKILLTESETKI